MHVLALFPLILCLAGLITWAITERAVDQGGSPRIAKVAWACFVIGLAVFTYAFQGWVWKF